jgi:Type II site-specific deoxyribonuclease
MVDFRVSVTAAEERRLREFISALRTRCEAHMNPKSTWNSEEFESEFRSKLLTHHCFMGSPLFQESFDSAFIAACSHAGHQVEQAPPGQRFWDVMIDGRRISLKSSKARSLREETLHISKLTEAAWIQDCRTAAKRREYTHRLFRQYCSEVDGIVQLRYFHSLQLYELVEIPASLFSQVLEVGRAHFSADGPTINIPVGKDPPDFTLKLDRSDAKITIANINKHLCLVHGTWQL